MTESEFMVITDALLESLQTALDSTDLDLDYQLNGGVLEIEFESGEQIVINRHTPNREIWVAARSGGFHFSLDPQQHWINHRDQSELTQVLSQLISASSGANFTWA